MFSDKLKELRTSNNMTQEELASKLYVTRNAVSKWETGKGYPSIDSLKDISKLFNISIDELINDKDIKMITLENSSTINQQKKVYLSGLIFIIYALFGIIFPIIVFSNDPTAGLAYFIVLRPISIILLSFISCFILKKPVYAIIASALALLPIHIYFEMGTEINIGIWEEINWLIFVICYLLMIKLITHSYKKKTLTILKYSFLSLFLITTLIYLILSLISIITYDINYTSFPWYAQPLLYLVYFFIPLLLTLILFLYFHFKAKNTR